MQTTGPRPIEVVGGVIDELDVDLARLNDLELTSRFDIDAFLGECAQQAHAAGDAGDMTAETMKLSQGGAMDTSSTLVGSVENVGGVVDSFSGPGGERRT